MENINWICKAKTVNNNIVWMCSPKIKEHFESTSTTALLGSTIFPKSIDITLGTPSFGPTSDLCKDTTGFTKLGEWKLVMNDGTPAMNNELYEGKTKGLMVYNGAKTTEWSKFLSEWQYVYQTPYFCGTDNTGFNAASAFLDIYNYQDFNTIFWTVLYRNKNKPENYFLMPRMKVNSTSVNGIIGMSASNFDPGYAQDRNLNNYKILGWTPEFTSHGQGGGSIIYDEVYEVFIKPFTRPSYLFKQEPKTINFSPLDSTLASKLFFWLDGSDPLADGSVLADDTKVPYWFDKSSNKIRFVRTPEDYSGRFFSKIKDGEKTQDGTKLRVPRAKASIKNGLSTMRFNGRQGYRINTNDPEDPVTSKFIQNPVNANITEYTVISLQFTADYGTGNGSRIFSPDNYSGGFCTMIGNLQFDAPMLTAWTNANNRNDHSLDKSWHSNVNVLGQWSLFTVVVSNSDLSFYVNGVKGKNNLLEWQLNQKPYEAKDGKLLGLNNCCIVGVGSTDNGNMTGSAFIGDLAELLFFRGALSDDDRQKVEGYLGIKWNIASSLPESNPYTIDIANSAQLFTGTNYGATSNYFPVGRYNNSQLKTIGVKTLQSLKVPSGLQVLLYQNGDFTGLGKSIIADTPDLSSVTDNKNTGFKWNNQMQSLIVQKYIPLPTSISSDMPDISLISSDANSFLTTVNGAVLSRIDNKDYLFVDPSNKYNVFWYNASDLMVTPPAPKFDVTTISGLQNWYDASDPLATGTLPDVGTAIKTWNDKADTKNNATAANGYGPVPTFQNDGKPFIDFKDTFYNIKNPWQWMAGSYYTVFIVAGTGVGRDGNRYVILLGGGEEGTYMIGQDAAWFRMPSRNFREFPISSRDKNIVLNNNSGATPELYAVSYRDDEIYIRLTGAQVVKRDGNNLIHKQKLSPNATDPVSVIGTKGNGNWVRYTGRYREILAFKGPMAESDIQKVEGYLAWKWGLNKTLPNNHPYFAKSP